VARAGLGVLNSEGVTLSIWYAAGTVADASALVLGTTLPWDSVNQANGFPGYYSFTEVQVPTVGTYTFQIRATGNGIDTVASRSALWQETGVNAITDPPTPATQSSQSIGLVVSVPEPSTFALAGLGSAALVIFRRRKS